MADHHHVDEQKQEERRKMSSILSEKSVHEQLGMRKPEDWQHAKLSELSSLLLFHSHPPVPAASSTAASTSATTQDSPSNNNRGGGNSGGSGRRFLDNTVDLRWKKVPLVTVLNLCGDVGLSTVHTVDFGGLGFGDLACEAVGQMMIGNSQLTKLDVSRCKITDVGCEFIAKALKLNRALQELHLDWNQIGDKACSSLSTALHRCKLKQFDIHANQLTSVGMERLAAGLVHNKHLKLLEVRMNPLGDKGVAALCQALQQDCAVTNLDLASSSFGLAGMLSVNSLLKSSDCQIETIDLENNYLSEECVLSLAEGLRGNHTVTQLSLYKNPLTGAGLRMLTHSLLDNATISHILLGRCRLSNADCVHLYDLIQGCVSLAHLDLEGNGISDEGFIEILHGARLNTNRVEQLSLRENAVNGFEQAQQEALQFMEEQQTRRNHITIDLQRNRRLATEFIAAIKHNYQKCSGNHVTFLFAEEDEETEERRQEQASSSSSSSSSHISAQKPVPTPSPLPPQQPARESTTHRLRKSASAPKVVLQPCLSGSPHAKPSKSNPATPAAQRHR